jgi:hypothetical protein
MHLDLPNVKYDSARNPASAPLHFADLQVAPWGDLTDEVKEWDRQTVSAMQKFLAEVGFEIYHFG